MSDNEDKKKVLLSDVYLRPKFEEQVSNTMDNPKKALRGGITDIDKIFCWMPGFIAGYAGMPKKGKTTFTMFLMLVLSVIDGKKWALWSPEMIVSMKKDGKVIRSADYIYNLLIKALTGIDPLKLVTEDMDKYMEAFEFVKEHFYVIDTVRDNSPGTLIEAFRQAYYELGIFGWMADSFKNINYEEGKGTKDRALQYVVDDFKYMTIETDTCGCFILHPRGMKERELRKNGTLKGPYKVITQHDLLGGSVWDNSLDTLYSWYRQNIHDDANDPAGTLICINQKMQENTNKPGEFDGILYDIDKNRFYFSGICPLDGSVIDKRFMKTVTTQTQAFDMKSRMNGKKQTPPIITDEVPF